MNMPKIKDMMEITQYFFEWVTGYYDKKQMWEIHFEGPGSLWKVRKRGSKDKWNEFNPDTFDPTLNGLKIDINDFFMKLYAVNIMHAGGLHFQLDEYRRIFGEDEVEKAADRWKEYKGMLIKSISPLLEDENNRKDQKKIEPKSDQMRRKLSIVEDNNEQIEYSIPKWDVFF